VDAALQIVNQAPRLVQRFINVATMQGGEYGLRMSEQNRQAVALDQHAWEPTRWKPKNGEIWYMLVQLYLDLLHQTTIDGADLFAVNYTRRVSTGDARSGRGWRPLRSC
jgi:hypothetical protein